MYPDLISMSNARSLSAKDVMVEREPPVPPGEPTALNQERAGQCTEALRRRIKTVRGRSSW